MLTLVYQLEVQKKGSWTCTVLDLSVCFHLPHSLNFTANQARLRKAEKETFDFSSELRINGARVAEGKTKNFSPVPFPLPTVFFISFREIYDSAHKLRRSALFFTLFPSPSTLGSLNKQGATQDVPFQLAQHVVGGFYSGCNKHDCKLPSSTLNDSRHCVYAHTTTATMMLGMF